MSSRTRPECHDPSIALRLHSAERLLADLRRAMVVSEPDAGIDYRDVLIGFAPFFDCAQRLGVNPITLFAAAAKDRGHDMRELAAAFARRTDVTLEAFGWTLAERTDGPCYQPDRRGSPPQRRRHASHDPGGWRP